MEQKLKSLHGLNAGDLEKMLSTLPRFRVKQVYSWIIKGAASFNEMKNIPLTLQNELKSRFCIFDSAVSDLYNDSGAQKAVITLRDNLKIESVLLNDGKDRYTACLSTQAGCPAGCVFCKTGSLSFSRNLDYSEITQQFFHLQKTVKKIKHASSHLIDNIVVMGMGQPLLNIENLRRAVSFFTDPEGMNFSIGRITVSTCGIEKALFDIAENGPFFRLALSLPTADEKLRNKLMPVSANNYLVKIKQALTLYQKKCKDRITIEVPLLGGVNTTRADALSIAEFSKGLKTIVNIIPWNPVEGFEFEGKPLRQPEKNETADFISMLEKNNLKVTLRLHKGRKVMGACGQLGAV